MKSPRLAFSLIEVTIVILLVGILAAVSAPRFAQSVRVMRLEAAAKQLAAHITYVRRVAVNEGRSTSLSFDNSRYTYHSDGVDDPDRMGELLFVSIPTDYDPTFTLVANFDSQSELLFDFEGVPHSGSSPLAEGQIVLACGDDEIVVTISAGSGATTVRRGAARSDVDAADGREGEYESVPLVAGGSGATT